MGRLSLDKQNSKHVIREIRWINTQTDGYVLKNNYTHRQIDNKKVGSEVVVGSVHRSR